MANTKVGQSPSCKLTQFLLSYGFTPHSTTGVPPSELFLKRTLRTRLDLMKPDVSKVVTQNQAKQENNYNGRIKLREFQLGSNVLVKNFCQGSKWIAGTVKEKVGPLSYMIELPNGRLWKCHIDHIQEGGRSELEPQIESRNQQDARSKDQTNNEQESFGLSKETLTSHYPTHIRKPPC